MRRTMYLLVVAAVAIAMVSGDDEKKPDIGLNSKDEFTKAIAESDLLLFVYSSE